MHSVGTDQSGRKNIVYMSRKGLKGRFIAQEAMDVDQK